MATSRRGKVKGNAARIKWAAAQRKKMAGTTVKTSPKSKPTTKARLLKKGQLKRRK